MNMTGQPSRVAAMSFTKISPKKMQLYRAITGAQNGPLFVRPKVDGIRCLATTNGLHTKNGHPINAVFHIQQDIFKVLYREYKDFDPHTVVLDGELYADENTSINELSSAIRCHPLNLTLEDLRKQQRIKYYVFDVFFLEKQKKNIPFKARQSHLRNILHSSISSKLRHIVHVKSAVIRSRKDYEKSLENFVRKGNDGIVIYHPEGKYELRQRSKMAWKYLPRHLAWYSIVSVQRSGAKALRIQCRTLKNKRFTLSLRVDVEKIQALRKCKDLRDYEARVQFYKLLPSGVPRFGTAIGFRLRKSRGTSL